MPVLLPLVEIYEVPVLQLGVIMVLNLSIGLLTPPVGVVLSILASVGKVPYDVAMRGAISFWPPLVFTLLAITYIPALTAWLPSVVNT